MVLTSIYRPSTDILARAKARQYDRTHSKGEVVTEIVNIQDLVMESWIARLMGKTSH